MKLFVALFALAAAQDQGAETTQGADASQGYGEEQSYAAAPTTSYGEESYAPAYVKVHHVCLGECFEEAPCLNTDTGACVPKVGGSQYAAPQFEGQQTGYRRLAEESDNSYGYEAPAAESYAAPVESYAAAPVAYAAPAPEFGCPDGTVDTGCMYVSKPWPFWVGFILLFLPSFYFLCEVYWVITTNVGGLDNDYLDTAYLRKNVRGLHFLAAGFVLTIASLAYLTMATGHGYILRCCDGRSFYYTRYIDWTLTTPIMLWELATICCNIKQWYFTWLFFLDVLMIISGLIGSLMCGGEKWIFWGFGVICFIPVVGFLCQFDYFLQATRFINMDSPVPYIQYYDCSKIQAANDRPKSATNGEGTDVWVVLPNSGPIYESVIERLQKYRTAMYLTVIAWFFYPIVWIFAEGTGSLCSMGEAICYTVLDVISKSVFGWIIVEGRAANHFHTIRFRINTESGGITEWVYIDPTHTVAFPISISGAHGHSKTGTFATYHDEDSY